VATDVTERARLQREILEISDREQARIGQDVHDGLCQQLIGMGFSVNSLEQSLSSQRRSEAAIAAKLCTLLDGAIDEARRVCRGLYPIRLSKQGLQSALEELATTAQERYGILCSCEPDGAPSVCDLATATHLYRIAQEAVNNAAKHSGAGRISIRLGRTKEAILLEISDNGKGLQEPSSLASTNRSGGMGLHIMRYRATVMRGELEITSNESGTTVSCRVPRTI
jgi:signal transduction histidine kinase